MDSVWPEGRPAAAFFSFDVDGESWLLVADERNATLPVTISQAAYGPKVGVALILDILRDAEVTSTFFVPSLIAERYPLMVERIVEGGHEVGLHGHCHERPDLLEESEEAAIISKSIDIIERTAGTRPIGFRAPAAEISLSTNRLLVEHGVEYTSHHMDAIVPYFHEEGLLELPMHWVCDDWGYAMVSPNAYPAPHVNPIMTNEHVISMWSNELDAIVRLGGLFTLVNHPQVTGRPYRLATLEAILERANASKAWIANGAAIHDHWKRQTRPDD